MCLPNIHPNKVELDIFSLNHSNSLYTSRQRKLCWNRLQIVGEVMQHVGAGCKICVERGCKICGGTVVICRGQGCKILLRTASKYT